MACAAAVLTAPPERAVERDAQTTLRAELARIVTDPKLAASVLALALGALALVDQVTKWSRAYPAFWGIALGSAGLLVAYLVLGGRGPRATISDRSGGFREGPG